MFDDMDVLLVAVLITATIFMIIWGAITSSKLCEIKEMLEAKLEPSVTCIEKDGKRYCEVADEE